MSRSRWDLIKTNKLLPTYVEILVPESEKSQYEAVVENPVITTPDDVEGLGSLRNWCLKHFKEETLIMVDDDIQQFYCLTGETSRRVEDPDELMQILINTAVMAKDAGAKVFGFAQSDIRKFKGYDPFCLCSWIGTIIGVIGRKYEFRKDKFKVDIDYCLQNLLIERIIWMDSRYWVLNLKDLNTGGNGKFRTQEAFQKSIDTLVQKWGDCIKVSDFKNQKRIRLNVSRKQNITY